MAIPQRYEEFSIIDDLAMDALLKRGKADNYRFTTVREGVLLEKGIETPNHRPDLKNGLPRIQPKFRDPGELDDLEMEPRPNNRFTKPRPPGF